LKYIKAFCQSTQNLLFPIERNAMMLANGRCTLKVMKEILHHFYQISIANMSEKNDRKYGRTRVPNFI